MTEPVSADTKPVVLELEPGNYAWCACGKSANQPFCDGSHRGSGITPIAFTVTEKKKAAYCLCKHSANKPFCDGTHKTISK
ncbi:MAG: CDGSH iron-sulfur domain-containing protein [Candidatus Hydrogenedentota bacterium]